MSVCIEGIERLALASTRGPVPSGSGLRSGHHHLRSQRRVAVHVLEICIQRGIGIVQHVVSQLRRRTLDANIFMNESLFEVAGAPAEQAQLAVGIKATMPYPAAEKEILPGNPEAR